MENKKDSPDLTKIKGLGRKTADILREGGITSLHVLANSNPDFITEIFNNAEYQYQIKTETINAWIEEAARYLEGGIAISEASLSPSDSNHGDYHEDPSYEEILVDYQNAEWEACKNKLEALILKYPDDQRLRSFLDEVNLQSSLHEEDIVAISVEKKAARKSKRLNMFISVVILVVLIGLVMAAIPIIENRVEATRIEQAIQDEKDLLAKIYLNAENLLEAGRPLEALTEIEEIQKINPDYPGLDDLFLEVQRQTELEDLYETAANLREKKDFESALDVFLQINEVDPYFKDIEQQISFLETETSYQDWVISADQAFNDRNWKDAVDGYEEALRLDASSTYTHLEDNLYDSYLNRIIEMLQGENLSLEEIKTAENYYKNALALKPQDLESLDQREAMKRAVTDLLVDRLLLSAQALIAEGGVSDKDFTAAENNINKALALDSESSIAVLQQDLFNRYKSGLENFIEGEYVLAAQSLEYLYQRDNDYAGGGAAYLLYESYFATGQDWLDKGRYSEALGEFQRSEIMALKNPENNLPIFQSRQLVAHTLGKLGAYEDAAFHYSNLVEIYDLLTLAELSGEDLQEGLLSAAEDMALNKYREAYLAYEKAFEYITSIYSYDSTIAAGGDSIPSLAFQFNSTILGIIEANNFPPGFMIFNDGVYLIPYFSVD